ncbi:MAG: serine dehydratase subunit alpha family protein, partial [Spirochaetaceae bacterium]|nr:serine dehydratase subunit alpha family protein [Spirochaetaceae bacterium]
MTRPGLYEAYLALLRSELVPALGCTEPIAVAYAAAKAREALGSMPERLEVRCSGNIVKNVKGVTVPNTGGLKGVDAAAIAGVVGGKPDRGLEVLESLGDDDRAETKRLRESGFCAVSLAEGVEGLHIEVRAFSGDDSAEVLIAGSHTNIRRVARNGLVLFEGGAPAAARGAKPGAAPDRSLLNVRDILEFAESVRMEDVGELLAGQVRMNCAISDEGLRRPYGADIGKTLLKCFGSDLRTRAKARAAAGSDARMSGCALPVVINSGSGNQGMTVSLPVVEYAREYGASEEALHRALVLSNLVSIHQKTSIG